jgi:hypothetical protein
MSKVKRQYHTYSLDRLHSLALGLSTAGHDPEWRRTINRLHRDHRNQLLAIVHGFEQKMFAERKAKRAVRA